MKRREGDCQRSRGVRWAGVAAGRGNGMNSVLRRAFTLVELLVVISILSLLVALLLPAVMAARGSARRAQCQNNLHNVGLAMLSELSAKRRFPASGHFGVAGYAPYHSWVVALLPWLERADLAEEWKLDRPSTDPGNQSLGRVGLPILVCPDDISEQAGEGNLSYAVNGGFGWTAGSPSPDCPSAFHKLGFPPIRPMDLNGNGITCPASGPETDAASDKQLFFQTGLFFLENWPPGEGTARHHSADSIADGLSTTLMLAENVRAGYDPYGGVGGGWASPVPQHQSFFLSSYVCEGARCAAGRVDYRRANSRTHPYALEAINSALEQAEGEAPWPSSYHSGGVNAVYADGHVQFLSETIDGPVYASLVSPCGSRIEGPLKQAVVPGEF